MEWLEILFYLIVSFGLGWLSTLAECDYVASLDHSIIQFLIALMAIYASISFQLIIRLLRFRKVVRDPEAIDGVVDSLKNNVKAEVIIILVTFLVLTITPILEEKGLVDHLLIIIIKNGVIVFSLLYFVVMIYDISMGLFKMLDFKDDNNSSNNELSK